MHNRRFSFNAKVWQYEGMGGWYFVTLPEDESDIVKDLYGQSKRGFGSIRVEVTIGTSRWKTSIFPDMKRGAYILPLKADIRKREHIKINQKVKITITLLV
jgi:hypothetical protein